MSAALLAGCAAPKDRSEAESPALQLAIAAPSETQPFAKKHMIAAANPLAAKAGLEILRKGGSAIDAAIAAQLVLGLVEPQSSGIGGGAFMVTFNAKSGEIATFDGRETAPDGAAPDMFLGADGKPKAFKQARLGGLSVGVPGLVAMLELAHQDGGKLEWKELFAPAIKLAEEGFAVSPRLAEMIKANPDLNTFKAAREYFFDDEGKPLIAGYVRTNAKLAQTYRTIANDGASAFYLSSIGYDVAQTVRDAATNPATMNGNDLVAYRAQKRNPVCGPYRTWLVCGMGPPSSGGIATLQILGILQNFDLPAMTPAGTQAVHLVAEASKLAFADRAAYIGDPRYVPWPEGLIDPDYLSARAKLIDADMAAPETSPGMPGMTFGQYGLSDESEGVSTTHLSVIDGDGNAVSMTSSIESAFGSRLMVRGFLLNNQLTDFSFRPEQGGAPVANQAGPRRRPRSSMAPTLVFDGNGEIKAAVGSPGGSSIIGYVAATLIGMLDWNLSPDQAISMPHFLSRGGAVELEAGVGAEVLQGPLEAMGHEVKLKATNSGLHMVGSTEGGLTGAADPRREGVVLGD
ncbi:MAG: gamma-glutamyltransferase [Rhodospirillaceae bacterium]|nr:gamma-glutamyltransferase [Rhodospirillaceae bacterium]